MDKSEIICFISQIEAELKQIKNKINSLNNVEGCKIDKNLCHINDNINKIKNDL